MATVKKSKKRFIVPIAIILVIAIVITSVVVANAANGGEQVTLNTIQTGDIYENVSATGEVTAGASRSYKVGSVATVKEVFVKVGDRVKEGDKLATFDTSNFDSQISKLQQTYNDAKKSYNAAVKSQSAAKKKLSSVNKEISKLEKEVNKLNKTSTSTTKKKTTTKKAQTTGALTTVQVPTTAATTTTTGVSAYTVKAAVLAGQESYGTVAVGNNAAGAVSSGQYAPGTSVVIKAVPAKDYTFAGWFDADGNKIRSSRQIQVTVNSDIAYIAQFSKTTSTSTLTDLADALAEISDTIKSMSNDVNTAMKALEVTSKAISDALANNVTDSQVIAASVQNAIIYAVQQGVINEDNLNVAGEVLASSIAKAVKEIDWKSIVADFTNTKDVQLTTKQLQLVGLYAQAEMYSIEASDTAVSAKKDLMNTAGDALETLKESSAELEAGWTASFDGTVTACDLEPGEQTSLVSDGITLENMNTMVVTISLSEYDNYKVKVGMPCVVTTAYGKYEGEVTAKAPTATGGSSSSILDNMGSMAGISGLSSLTSSGAGVECTIEVKEPDENIIIGFDADVEIEVGVYNDVVVVPIESIVLEKTGTFVYLYDEEEKKVTKTPITTGAVSDSAYEVKEGLKAGDKIISAPSTSYEDESFKVKVVDKK